MKLKKLLHLFLFLFLFFSTVKAQEIHTQANAASILNEANSTNGWQTDFRATFSSSTINPFSGTYSISVTSIGTSRGGYAFYTFPANIGQVYNISIWAREGNSSFRPAFANWSGFSNFSTTVINGSGWTQYTWSLTATSANPQIRVYTSPISGGQIGNEVLFDNVSILPEGGDNTSPTAPSALGASNITDTTVDLSWTASTDAVGVTDYLVYNNGALLATTGSTATTYQVTGLTPETAYNLTVRAVDAATNESADSNAQAFSTTASPDNTSPTAPSALGASNITDTTVDLSWTASTDAVGVTDYLVYNNGTLLATTGSTATTYQVTGLTPETAYNLTVRAVDAATNESADSNAQAFSTTASPDNTSPTAPSALGASNITDTTVDLSWTASTDAVGVTDYLVYNNGTLLATTGSTATTYQVTGLTPETAYNLTVRAVDAATNESADSNAQAFSTTASPDNTSPTAPSALGASNITDTTVDLSWTASTDAVGVTDYLVYNNGTLLATTGSTATTYQVTGLTPETAYNLTVRAVDAAANESADSNAQAFSTTAASPDNTSPTAPSALGASNITDTTVDLSWTASTDAVGVTDYLVYNNGTLLATTGSTATTYQVTGLTPETAYNLTVRAVDAAANESADSNAQAFSTTASPDNTSPTAPSALGASNITDTTVDLSWTASTDAVGVTDYLVYNNGALLATTGSTATTYQVTGLTPETAYNLTVRAVDAATNESADSNAQAFSTTASPDNTSPTAPSALGASNITDTTVDLSWTASTDAVGVTDYLVYNNGTLLATTGSTATTYQVTGLTPETAYNLTVRAVDAATNESADSNAQAFSTTAASPDNTSPTAPSALGASNITDTTVDLSWTASTDAVGVTDYLVYNNGTLLATTGSTATTYQVTGLTPETAYNLTVRAVDAAANESADSNAQAFSTTASPDNTSPTAPSALGASNITDTTVDLSWTASTDAVGVTDYLVYNNGALLATTGSTATTYQVTGLTPETAYNLTVRAVDAATNESADSNAQAFSTTASPDNTSPTAPSALGASNITDTTVDLSWTASTDAVGVTDYLVYNNGALLATTGSTATTYQVTGLTPETAYNLTVRAVDAATNESADSNAQAFSTTASPDNTSPTAPSALGASNITDTTVDLSWTASTDAVGVTDYLVYNNGTLLATTGSTATTYQVTGLTPETAYNLTVRAVDAAANESADSNAQAFSTTASPDNTAPDAINDLAALNITDTTVDLIWSEPSDNVGVTGYEVFQNGTSIGTTLGATTFNVIGLNAVTPYTFTVFAEDAAGNVSLVSNPVNINTTFVHYTTENANMTSIDWQARDINASRDILVNRNLGIGTINPIYELNVDGTINASEILVNGLPLQNSSVWNQSGSDIFYNTGNVGIGTNNTQGYRLAVAGNVIAESMKVELQVNWPDFVFTKNYGLPSLETVEQYILEKGHLLNIPSAKDVAENGLDLGEMNAKLLQKIEELTLYTIQQEKRINNLEGENMKMELLMQRLIALEKLLKDKE